MDPCGMPFVMGQIFNMWNAICNGTDFQYVECHL